MTTLETLLKDYDQLQNQEQQIKAAKESLREQILQIFASNQLTDYTTQDEQLKAKVISKVTFKYTDEAGIMNYLKMRGMGQYLKTTIDTVALNKQLKTSTTLQEGLAGKYVANDVPSLTVKRI